MTPIEFVDKVASWTTWREWVAQNYGENVDPEQTDMDLDWLIHSTQDLERLIEEARAITRNPTE